MKAKHKPPPLTDGEIRYALYKQSATINALVAMLQEKGLLSTEDLDAIEWEAARRKRV